jgi:FAD/FMN-containing dehydrogenase
LELTRDDAVRASVSRDASGLELVPEYVARPATVAEVSDVIIEAAGLGTFVTAAGSQTSMTGASITDSGVLLSMMAMNAILDVDEKRRIARVQPAVTIGDLNRAIADTGLHFAPDPTSENDATIGGAIACNASGARSLRHGATRGHVYGVTVVGADGTPRSRARSGLEKDTVGFAAAQDPVDWYVGSEGTLGVIVEAELRLLPLPRHLIGLAIPFPDDSSALSFVIAARESLSHSPHCLEYFDREALIIAGTASARPWSEECRAMVYLEDDAELAGLDAVLDGWLEIAEHHQALTSDIRAFDTPQALRDARIFRHAVPATMNERGAAWRRDGGRKVSTDWSVPFRRLPEALEASRRASEKHGAPLPVTYGHAGNGHPHQNYIAESAAALAAVNAAVAETLDTVFRMGGTFSAEHGVGKLKKAWLHRQLSPEQVAVMKAMKNTLDPRGMFGPGNVL